MIASSPSSSRRVSRASLREVLAYGDPRRRCAPPPPPPPMGLGLMPFGLGSLTDPIGLGTADLWWRSDSVTVSAGSVVLAKDKTGKGHDAGPPTHAFSTPTYVASDANYAGLPSIQSPGPGNTFLECQTFAGRSQPNTLFVVGNFDSLAGTPVIFSNEQNGGFTRQFLYAAATWDIYAGAFVTGSSSNTSPHAWVLIFNGASSKIYVDSSAAAVGSGDASTNSFGGPLQGDDIVIGGNEALSCDCHWVDFVCYPGVLTGANIAALMSYAGARYGHAWS